MCIESILKIKSSSILIIEERENKDIVIGVPHHAPAGESELPCPEHPNSDENAGYLGRYIAEKLNCCSIIACNYRIDVNKYVKSDYSRQIAKWLPKFLVEIHGHAEEKTKSGYNIEISSGSEKKSKFAEELARKLEDKLAKFDSLKELSVCGKFKAIKFKASESVTITDDRWTSFHIELPPSLRISKNKKDGTAPKEGYEFCDCLIESLKEIYRKV